MRFMKNILIAISIFSSAAICVYSLEESKPVVLEVSFRGLSDHIYDEQSSVVTQNVKAGDIVFLNPFFMRDFFQKIHPQISVPYILISPNCDGSAPGEHQCMLDDDKLVAWFTQNPDGVRHPKLIPIPIGLFNKRQDQERGKPLQKNIQKKCLLYVNFDWIVSAGESRATYDFFKQLSFCSWSAKYLDKEYLTGITQAMFVLSPHGNGLDSHRIWEALYMGSFPLVKTSAMDPIYEDLPVLIVQNWTDINSEFLEKKYSEMKDKKYDFNKLYFNYWRDKVKDIQNQCRFLYCEDFDQQDIVDDFRAEDSEQQMSEGVQQQLLEIRNSIRTNDIPTSLEIVQGILEEMCPQERRTSLLMNRMEKSQKEMARKVREKKSKTVPLLTFIIPCYNRETVIREAIESIYAQNLTVPFEIIAIDDASRDRSYEILQEYEKKYDNFFAFKNFINQKAPTTRNNAVCYARGAYICNADSDDVFEPCSVQPMFDAMIAGGYDLAFFQELKFFNDQAPLIYHKSSSWPPNNEILLERMLKERYISVAAGNRIYSKESWLQSGGYLEDVGHDSWSFSYKQIANGYRGYVHPGSAYRHRTWSDESNMWYEEHRKNIHDISPQLAMLETPELFTTKSLNVIVNYKPKGSEFMEFVSKKMNKGEIELVRCFDCLLKGRFAENRGDAQSALDYYMQAIEQDPLVHTTVYIRALRIAVGLSNKPLALNLIYKLCSKQSKGK